MKHRNWIRAAVVGIAAVATAVSCSSSPSDVAFSGAATGAGGDITVGNGTGNASGSGTGTAAGGASASGTASGATASGGSTTGSMSNASAGTGGFGGAMSAVSNTVAASSTSGPPCLSQCSADLHTVLDCNNNPIQTCMGTDACDPMTKTCINACTAAINNKQSVGCEYYATDMEIFGAERCFAAFVANTWDTPVHISVDYQGAALNVATFARLPTGQGQALTYTNYDPVAGLPAGEMAILFLSGTKGAAPQCPTAGATQTATHTGTGVFDSFHITTDVPVVAYQINPYGGGNAAVTGASLLLPTSAWDVNYIAVDAYSADISPPSLNIVASQDATTVKFTPVAALQGAGGIPSGPAGVTTQFMLNKGQHAQITQQAELTGSVIETDKPVGMMAGQGCLRIPTGIAYCDHAEQMVPPIKALGHEYVGVMYRPRSNEPAIWRVVGAVDGTTLTYSNAVGGPATIDKGKIAEFTTGTPFVISSQDAMHPFMLFTYMSGSMWNKLSDTSGYGDADFVISVPPDQYLSNYVFFADPTYPETNLVIVRKKVNGMFSDVNLDCAGVLANWTPVGADYEWTRADLDTGNFLNVGNCSTGRHSISSAQPFGLWVWGWGTPLTSGFTANVSYGYPGGMNVQPINNVVVHM